MKRNLDALPKLHVGCGKRYIPGFVHIDVDAFPHIDYRHDIRSLPMFGDGTASLIYACHVVEYFDRILVLDVLREWSRVLAPGGVIRLAVPDFEALVKVYQRHHDLGTIIGPLFGRFPVISPSGATVLYHRTTYDYPSLESVLRVAGLTDVRRWDWRRTEHASVDDFSQAYVPHMDKENGTLISLNVEASKPAGLT